MMLCMHKISMQSKERKRFCKYQLVGVYKQFVIRFYHFIFIWHKFSCVLPSNIVRFISFFSICWHNFMFINVFGFNIFYYIFKFWERMEKKNENWNVLCIKAQFQMDYYLFNTTRKKRFLRFNSWILCAFVASKFEIPHRS